MKLLGVLVAVLAAVGVQSQPSRKPLATKKFSITSSMVDFAVELSTRQLDPGNTVFSPFSISSVLNLLLLGASDRTYDQLRTALRHPDGVEDLLIHQQSGIQLVSLEHQTEGVTVNIANRLFAARGLRVKEAFQSGAKTYYQAAVESLDFARRPTTSTRRVNQWISNVTAGKIPRLLTEPVSANTRMMAANVVYFNSSWQTPFDPDMTDARDFHVSPTKAVPADLMFGVLRVPHGVFRKRGFSVVGLPYSGGRHGMYVFLPDEAGEAALARLERHLGAAELSDIVGSLHEADVLVGLPRFKMSHTVSLSGALQRMGVRDLFSPERASLKRLADEKPLYVSEVLHQTVIDVHERGTEAAAATISFASRSSFKQPEFIANRPFLFIIRDNKTGVPLFWGRLVEPEPSQR